MKMKVFRRQLRRWQKELESSCRKRKKAEESRRQADYRSILFSIQKEAALYFYHQLMSENGKRGYLYLRSRGLSDETIKNFGLGYANQYPDDLYRFLRQKGFSDAQLKDSGHL